MQQQQVVGLAVVSQVSAVVVGQEAVVVMAAVGTAQSPQKEDCGKGGKQGWLQTLNLYTRS